MMLEKSCGDDDRGMSDEVGTPTVPPPVEPSPEPDQPARTADTRAALGLRRHLLRVRRDRSRRQLTLGRRACT
jgi:hypothetical protein